MGKGKVITCNKCNTKKELLEGVGMLFSENALLDATLDYSLINFCDETSNLDKKKITEILKQDVCYLNKSYGYKTYFCPNCNNADSYFNFILYTNDNGKIIPEYLCKHCGNKMRIATNKDSVKYFCDNCNQIIDNCLDNTMFIDWD